ncbi:hypothetical protein [Burkholderia pyrrocinia]
MTIVVVAALGYPILNMCRFTGYCSMNGLKWMWHMTHKDEYGLIGQHLVPGKEYYFEVKPAYFDRDYPQHAPVSARQIEPQDKVVISAVRADQKTDWEVVYEKNRVAFDRHLDLPKFGIVVNGDYFFSIDPDGQLGKQITIDEAIRFESYVKVTTYLQKVKAAELVRRTLENRNRFTYWSTTGYRKEMIGFNLQGGQREDWHECYAESNGDHTPCPDVLRKP